MSTIPQIRDAIAAAVNGLPVGNGLLRGHGTYPGQVVPPAATVRRLSTRYGAQFNGREEHSMAVTLYLPLGDYPTAQGQLDTLLSDDGAGSVIAALRVDPSFGGVAMGSVVTDCAEEGVSKDDAGVQMLTATVNLTVSNV